MSGSNVISELECEWAQLRADPETVRIFEGLQEAEPVLAALEGLDDLVAVMAARACVADLDRHDEVLLALLRQARGRSRIGDLAARVMLQLLLPGLKSLCCDRYVAGMPMDERREVLLAALWEEIRAPRSAWKPFKVGAQVLGRARGRVRPPRGMAARVSVEPYGDKVPGELSDGRYPDASEVQSCHAAIGLLHLLAEAVADGLIGVEQAQLIATVRVKGEAVETVAERMGITAGAVAGRLHRAQEALVAALCQLMPDADAAAERRGCELGDVPVPR